MKEVVEFAVTTALSVTTIIVLIFTWRAALKQAKAAESQALAARALTASAEAQTSAAQDAAKIATEANSLAQRQMMGQSTPILVVTRDQAHLAGTADKARYLIENQGPGAAQDVVWSYAEIVLIALPQAISSTLIGAGCSAEITLDQGKLTDRGLTISYKSLDGRPFKTVVKLDGGVLTQRYT